MTAERLSPRPNQRHRFIPLIQIQQTPQRFAAVTLELRIVLHDPQRLVAGLRDQLGVHVGAGDAIAGQAALAGMANAARVANSATALQPATVKVKTE